MRRILFLLAILVALPFTAAFLPSLQGSGGGGGGSGVAFTSVDGPYFMAASGCSDSNNGTSAATPWCTPNHALNCGDVIIAATGSYTNDFATWGTVSNCPSTTAGTTGSGGVYTAVLLCGGALQTCTINCSTAPCNSGHVGSEGSSAASACMNVNTNHWAIEGWTCTGNGTSKRGFQADACLTTTTRLGYIAFINTIVYNSAQGYDTDECGNNTASPGSGIDEFAVVGAYVQNSNNNSTCFSAVDVVAPANFDALSGTHVIFAGIFAVNNSNLTSGCSSDGEGLMFDTWDAHGYSGQGYVYDNIVTTSSWAGLQVFMQSFNASSPHIYIDHNTFYNNLVCTPFSPKTGQSEINIQAANSFSWTINTTNNIVQTGRAATPSTTSCTAQSSVHTYAMLTGTGSSVSFSTTGNFFAGEATACDGTCDTGDNVVWFNSGGPGSGNTYGTGHAANAPGFANESDMTNWQSTPSCSGDITTTQCIGWNYTNQTATSLTPIADLTPSASGTSGIGYVPPGACAANSLWPTWLNYIVYLQWSGTTLTENPGLVPMPCNV